MPRGLADSATFSPAAPALRSIARAPSSVESVGWSPMIGSRAGFPALPGSEIRSGKSADGRSSDSEAAPAIISANATSETLRQSGRYRCGSVVCSISTVRRVGSSLTSSAAWSPPSVQMGRNSLLSLALNTKRSESPSRYASMRLSPENRREPRENSARNLGFTAMSMPFASMVRQPAPLHPSLLDGASKKPASPLDLAKRMSKVCNRAPADGCLSAE